MKGNSHSPNNNEERIINLIKEACGIPQLKSEDWNKYGPKVIQIK